MGLRFLGNEAVFLKDTLLICFVIICPCVCMCDYLCVCVLCLSSFASVCQSLKPHGCVFWIAPPNISLTLTAAVSALISHWLMPVEFTEGGV